MEGSTSRASPNKTGGWVRHFCYIPVQVVQIGYTESASFSILTISQRTYSVYQFWHEDVIRVLFFLLTKLDVPLVPSRILKRERHLNRSLVFSTLPGSNICHPSAIRKKRWRYPLESEANGFKSLVKTVSFFSIEFISIFYTIFKEDQTRVHLLRSKKSSSK